MKRSLATISLILSLILINGCGLAKQDSSEPQNSVHNHNNGLIEDLEKDTESLIKDDKYLKSEIYLEKFIPLREVKNDGGYSEEYLKDKNNAKGRPGTYLNNLLDYYYQGDYVNSDTSEFLGDLSYILDLEYGRETHISEKYMVTGPYFEYFSRFPFVNYLVDTIMAENGYESVELLEIPDETKLPDNGTSNFVYTVRFDEYDYWVLIYDYKAGTYATGINDVSGKLSLKYTDDLMNTEETEFEYENEDEYSYDPNDIYEAWFGEGWNQSETESESTEYIEIPNLNIINTEGY